MNLTGQRERAETTIQSVVLVPVVFLLVFMCFHFGSLYHQTHIAQLAANRGATVGSAFAYSHESAKQAQSEAERVARELGSALTSIPEVSYRDQGLVVKVSLRTSTAISFLPSIATAEAWRPLESFRLEQDRK
jgi:hypothetical protein